MPVTAKLSQKFHQRLGDEVANELVEWLNAVDTSYRQEFKGLFEANFGRVEARMDQLRAEVQSELGRVGARMDQLRAEVSSELARLEARSEERSTSLLSRMDAVESRRDAKLEGLKSELLRWMFLFWVGTMGTVLAIVKL